MNSPSRRSFSQKNLAWDCHGEAAGLLKEALLVPPEDGYGLTHGFHPYPGRFHRALPRTVLSALQQGAQHQNALKQGAQHQSALQSDTPKVFDPFMGGGTALVEAMLLGLECWGNDLNPVALLVARERTRPRSESQARELRTLAEGLASQVEALRREKNPPRCTLRFPHLILPHHPPHLLAELLQWNRLIRALPPGAPQETLQAVFSSGVVKYSTLATDSGSRGKSPAYPKGAVTRFLIAKCHQLAQAQLNLTKLAGAGAPLPHLLCEDSRLLPSLAWGQFDLIITSPPYPGTYDYFQQHQLRLAWLETPIRDFESGEIGSRRAKEPVRWNDALRDVLGSLARVVKPEGALYLVLGDWIEKNHAVNAAATVERAAQAKGWRLHNRASVRREAHSHRERKIFSRRGKWEHLLHFTQARG